ncbi:hypothetical protein R3P38DRAFT_2936214 [Favolaschia claudopus]|uniref:NADH dehydrogenase [ubiquinone] iron-sulfur protein 5-B n=1 Tax=Favolaschia claudopus TaxID=2862362 RepID=A0AAW0BQ39_9AGAR
MTPRECAAQRDDYLECVHRTKEKARHAAIQAEYETTAGAAGRRGPTRVGLVPTPPSETK